MRRVLPVLIVLQSLSLLSCQLHQPVVDAGGGWDEARVRDAGKKNPLALPYEVPSAGGCPSMLRNPTYAKATCSYGPGKVVCRLGKYTFVINNGDHAMEPEVIERFAAMLFHRTQEGDRKFDVSVDADERQKADEESRGQTSEAARGDADLLPVYVECSPVRDERRLQGDPSQTEIVYSCRRHGLGLGTRAVISVGEDGRVSDGNLVLPYRISKRSAEPSPEIAMHTTGGKVISGLENYVTQSTNKDLNVIPGEDLLNNRNTAVSDGVKPLSQDQNMHSGANNLKLENKVDKKSCEIVNAVDKAESPEQKTNKNRESSIVSEIKVGIKHPFTKIEEVLQGNSAENNMLQSGVPLSSAEVIKVDVERKGVNNGDESLGSTVHSENPTARIDLASNNRYHTGIRGSDLTEQVRQNLLVEGRNSGPERVIEDHNGKKEQAALDGESMKCKGINSEDYQTIKTNKVDISLVSPAPVSKCENSDNKKSNVEIKSIELKGVLNGQVKGGINSQLNTIEIGKVKNGNSPNSNFEVVVDHDDNKLGKIFASQMVENVNPVNTINVDLGSVLKTSGDKCSRLAQSDHNAKPEDAKNVDNMAVNKLIDAEKSENKISNNNLRALEVEKEITEAQNSINGVENIITSEMVTSAKVNEAEMKTAQKLENENVKIRQKGISGLQTSGRLDLTNNKGMNNAPKVEIGETDLSFDNMMNPLYGTGSVLGSGMKNVPEDEFPLQPMEVMDENLARYYQKILPIPIVRDFTDSCTDVPPVPWCPNTIGITLCATKSCVTLCDSGNGMKWQGPGSRRKRNQQIPDWPLARQLWSNFNRPSSSIRKRQALNGFTPPNGCPTTGPLCTTPNGCPTTAPLCTTTNPCRTTTCPPPPTTCGPALDPPGQVPSCFKPPPRPNVQPCPTTCSTACPVRLARGLRLHRSHRKNRKPPSHQPPSGGRYTQEK